MWQIRPTVPADVPGILALIGSIYTEYGCVFNPELDDPFLLDPGPYFRTTGGEFWVAVPDPLSPPWGEGGVRGEPVRAETTIAGRTYIGDALLEPAAAQASALPSSVVQRIALPPILATGAVKLHPDAGELKTLYVHPDARRHGLGRTLTEMAIAHARRAGHPRFFLWTDTRFLDAHRLYAAMGFVKFAERDLGDSNNSREYGFERSMELGPPAMPNPGTL